MKKKETKKLTETEILKNLDKLKKDLFNFRFQKINGQLKSPVKMRETRRSLARLKTMLGRKQNA
tara:strand:+ start:389 stop:580 length:192 start_codon:yes stop_codon:yes gene_type:complete